VLIFKKGVACNIAQVAANATNGKVTTHPHPAISLRLAARSASDRAAYYLYTVLSN
jgi:hypothetical protein